MRTEDGRFTKGNNGKPKGAKNRTTQKVREAFTELVENNLDKLQADLNTMTAKDRVRTILDLAQYIVPKLKATEVEFTQTEPQGLVFDDLIKAIRDNDGKIPSRSNHS